MKHDDHVDLLRGGVPGAGGIWADLGSGTGAFTLALADLIGAEGVIHSVDQDSGALQTQRRAMRQFFPDVTVHYHEADYTQLLNLPPLDGMVLANTLHFQPDKISVLEHLLVYLRPGGRLIVVEYDTDRGNAWVTYPFSYRAWEDMAEQVGLTDTRHLYTYPSRFLDGIYSAVSVKA